MSASEISVFWYSPASLVSPMASESEETLVLPPHELLERFEGINVAGVSQYTDIPIFMA